MVGIPGLEPGTSSLSEMRSNQLSYMPFVPRQCSGMGASVKQSFYLRVKQRKLQSKTMIRIIRAQFHDEITTALLAGATRVLESKNIVYDTTNVPGIGEMPIVAQRLSQDENTTGILCLGACIKGESNHYEVLLYGVTQGLNRVSLDAQMPLVQGIIAAPHRKTAMNRTHLGSEWAETLLTTIKTIDGL